MAKKPESAEIHPGPGFRVRSTITRPSKDLIEQYRQFPVPDISDLLNRLYTMSEKIRNVSNNDPIVGPAVTVKVYPGDNLMVHKALDIVEAGDIIVVDAGGSKTNAILGDLISNKAKHRGVGGFVIDGLVRDIPGIRETGLPVYSLGVTPIGPLHRGPGEINYPICCGGIVVQPGDLVLGDSNGVVVVRMDFADEILKRLYAQRESLDAYVADVKRGVFSNEWVDQVLKNASCRTSV